MGFETPKELEKIEKEQKEVYLYEIFTEVQNQLSEYLPEFYREIPTELNYKDKAEELKVNYALDGENLKINIETPENLSDKSIDEFKNSEIEFLVFKDVAEDKTISKKSQDFFFLFHEYIHGIKQNLIKEYRPDIVSIIEAKRKEYEEADEIKKKEIAQEEINSVFPVLGESLSISLEKVIIERLSQDPTLSEKERNDAELFWEKHKESLSKKKLEDNPESKYSELDEAMIYYKIYQRFGENGIISFIKGFNFDKLSKIKKYINPEKRILSKEYKDLLEMSGDRFMKEFN